ncbi:ATP-binding cassette domain-containing protein [Paenibacillus melissococcoides]|uniref:ATP-binding cassette domain-containing protein n=1 Tax=Paenibacillus melissococcoides TaxID=2912268 RepID=A0ABN8TXP9_9BACL|nr:ABC transporter transmembrane domain-containing protein [Paenibacillus melissococcoides]CAH8243517.1 ATP-binding cassette domain-containing protein [Paenibacillus melissococcoides]CAH8704745.1 ATP-binding cassette domain-containing protein [Paenibacillus melissococcoides]CAH8707977.1 ATP-binding cassette domain-containing protein [Paenibacillus melissococcoides]
MLSVLFKLGWFFKEHKTRYIVGVVMLIVVGIIELVPPRILGEAIDSIVRGDITWNKLTSYLLLILGTMVVIYAITYVWMYQIFGGANLVERKLRSKLMRHFLKMTPPFFEKNRTGDLMARATNDLRSVAQTAGFGMLTLTDSTAFLLIVLFAMFMIQWKLTLAALLPLPFIAIAMNVFGKKIHERYMIAQDAFGNMNDQVLESVGGVRVIRAYVQETSDEARFRDITQDVYDKNLAVARVDALFDPTIRLFIGLSYVIGLGYGAYLIIHNELSLGELLAFNMYLGMMIWPMFAIGNLINVMQRGNSSLDRVNEVLNYTPDVQDGEHTKDVAVPETLTWSNYKFRYPSSTTDNLNLGALTLRKGQTLGIVGRTGSGKSTFVKQLLREYPVGEGDFRINGIPAEQIPIDRLHSWIGYVPQEQILFSKTVKQNILFGRSGTGDDDVMNAIETASFTHDVPTLVHGVETLVGERGVALSGGQKQRVSLARAFIKDPEILILDDALSAVDARTEANIISNIREQRAGKTTLITTHRLSAVEHADWIIVLDDGKIVEEGTHDDLLKQDGWYKEQYERQQLESGL